jgi:hypothetical protein
MSLIAAVSSGAAGLSGRGSPSQAPASGGLKGSGNSDPDFTRSVFCYGAFVVLLSGNSHAALCAKSAVRCTIFRNLCILMVYSIL